MTFIYVLSVFVCLCGSNAIACVEVRGQFTGVYFHLLLGSNSGHEAWWQAPVFLHHLAILELQFLEEEAKNPPTDQAKPDPDKEKLAGLRLNYHLESEWNFGFRNHV